jgi:hypothetical protein
MEQTRESLTEKVEALENQVLGTIHNATATVSETVDAVKEAVTTAPTAVRNTIREMIDAVKETIGSFSVSGCISTYPAAAISTTTFAGFLAGYLTGGSTQSVARPAPYREPERTPSPRFAAGPCSGLLGELYDQVGGEVKKLASNTLASGMAALRQSIEKHLPAVIDSTVERVVSYSGTCDAGERNGKHRTASNY